MKIDLGKFAVCYLGTLIIMVVLALFLSVAYLIATCIQIGGWFGITALVVVCLIVAVPLTFLLYYLETDEEVK